MKDLASYKVIVFDCDGVVLDSNKIKTKAFFEATKSYGLEYAEQFCEYHVANGGISRYKKFDHFFESILKRQEKEGEKQLLLETYANFVETQLLCCDVTPGLASLRDYTAQQSWAIASGGDQAELRTVFQRRSLDTFFDLGVFGSPTPKEDILQALTAHCAHPGQMLMIGDSAYDYRAAQRVGADFLFVSAWTEMPQWREFVANHDLPAMTRVAELMESR